MGEYTVLLKIGGGGELEMEVNEPLGANLHRIYLNPTGSSFGPNLILNGDGFDTTDWIDSNTDGYPDYWLCKASSFMTYSIISSAGSGFTGNVLQVVRNPSTSGIVYANSNLATGTTSGSTYQLSFKYRAGYDLSVSYSANTCISPPGGYNLIETWSPNTGDAISVTKNFQPNQLGIGDELILRFTGDNDGGSGGSVWIQIDEINLREIL